MTCWVGRYLNLFETWLIQGSENTRDDTKDIKQEKMYSSNICNSLGFEFVYMPHGDGKTGKLLNNP